MVVVSYRCLCVFRLLPRDTCVNTVTNASGVRRERKILDIFLHGSTQHVIGQYGGAAIVCTLCRCHCAVVVTKSEWWNCNGECERVQRERKIFGDFLHTASTQHAIGQCDGAAVVCTVCRCRCELVVTRCELVTSY